MKGIDSTNRWKGNGYGKEKEVKPGLNITDKHCYSYPGHNGEGYFKVYADTYEELMEKIDKAHARRNMKEYQERNSRMIQGKYLVSGEPYA